MRVSKDGFFDLKKDDFKPPGVQFGGKVADIPKLSDLNNVWSPERWGRVES